MRRSTSPSSSATDAAGSRRRGSPCPSNSPSNSTGQGRDGLTILLRDGTGRFRIAGDGLHPTGAAPTRLAVGDLDGDGRQDVTVSNLNSGTVSLVLMGTGGRIAETTSVAVGREPKGVVVRDLNGDGKADLVAAPSWSATPRTMPRAT